eukprot:PITA_28180
MTLQPLETWTIDFIGPIQPQGKIGARFIITATEHLNHWVEAQPGTQFLNETISTLIEEFHVYHHKSTPYQPQANRTVEGFNKVLENALTKVCNAQRSDWDLRIPAVLWAYRTTCKNMMGQTPFMLVYGVEVVMPMEYIVPILRIETLTGMMDHKALEERLTQLDELEEEIFLVGFHQ